MTDLIPQIDEKADLTSILRTLTDQKSKPNVAEFRSKDTKTVEVRKGALEAIEALGELLRTVELPSDHRTLTREEMVQAAELAIKAKLTGTAVKNAVEAVKDAVFTHFDLVLEDAEGAKPGEASELVDENTGHYLVGQEVFVPDVGKRLCRELKEDAPTVTAKDLKTLWEAGKISRRDYLAATKHVDIPREVVDEQLAALLKRKPELLEVIAGAVTPGKVTAAFWVREPKKS